MFNSPESPIDQSQGSAPPFPFKSPENMDIYRLQEQESRLAAARAMGLPGASYSPYAASIHPGSPMYNLGSMFPTRASSYPFANGQMAHVQNNQSMFPPGTVDPRAMQTDNTFVPSAALWNPSYSSPQFQAPADYFTASPYQMDHRDFSSHLVDLPTGAYPIGTQPNFLNQPAGQTTVQPAELSSGSLPSNDRHDIKAPPPTAKPTRALPNRAMSNIKPEQSRESITRYVSLAFYICESKGYL